MARRLRIPRVMTTSNNLLLPLAPSKWLLGLVLLFGFIGFADATFLTIKHYTGTPLPCSFLNGCDTVTNSLYSTIGGLPVALLGALFYLAVILLTLAFWQKRQEFLLNTIWLFSLIAFLA